MLWWDIRPSCNFPTLEMRISDICTRFEDAVTIAAVFVCVIHMLYRLRRDNQRWRMYANMLISENRWRAQRYGLDEGLLDFGKGAIVPSGELMEELIDLIGEDAAALGCTDEVARIRTIVSDGTSAHMQVATYNAAIEGGAEPKQALDAVVDMLIDETVRGV